MRPILIQYHIRNDLSRLVYTKIPHVLNCARFFHHIPSQFIETFLKIYRKKFVGNKKLITLVLNLVLRLNENEPIKNIPRAISGLPSQG